MTKLDKLAATACAIACAGGMVIWLCKPVQAHYGVMVGIRTPTGLEDNCERIEIGGCGVHAYGCLTRESYHCMHDLEVLKP